MVKDTMRLYQMVFVSLVLGGRAGALAPGGAFGQMPPVPGESKAAPAQPVPAAHEEDQAVSTCLSDLTPLSSMPLRAVTRIGDIRIARFHGPLTLAQELDNLAFLLNHGEPQEGYEWKTETAPVDLLLHRKPVAQWRDQDLIAKDIQAMRKMVFGARQRAREKPQEVSLDNAALAGLSDSDFDALLNGANIPVNSPQIIRAALQPSDGVEETLLPESLLEKARAFLACTQDIGMPWRYDFMLHVELPTSGVGKGHCLDREKIPDSDTGHLPRWVRLDEKEVSPEIKVKDTAWKQEKAAKSEGDAVKLELGRVLRAVADAAHIAIYCEISPADPDSPFDPTIPSFKTLSGPRDVVLNQVAVQFGYNIIRHGDAYFLWSNRYPYDRQAALPARQYDAWRQSINEGNSLSVEQLCQMGRLREDQWGLLTRTPLFFIAHGDATLIRKVRQSCRFLDSLGPDLRRRASGEEGVSLASLNQFQLAAVRNLCGTDVPTDARLYLLHEPIGEGAQAASCERIDVRGKNTTYFSTSISLRPDKQD